MTKSLRNTLATLGIAAAVGATAIPMLSIWAHKDEIPVANIPLNVYRGHGVNSNGHFYGITTVSPLVIDLADSLDDAGVQALAKEYGLKLVPNSIEAKDNRLFRATLSVDKIKSLSVFL